MHAMRLTVVGLARRHGNTVSISPADACIPAVDTVRRFDEECVCLSAGIVLRGEITESTRCRPRASDWRERARA